MKGHLPRWTRNAYVMAAITERYNDALRRLAERKDITLLDLEAWADSSLVPRSRFFRDTVHLTEEGQQKLGRFAALELKRLVAEEQTRRH